MKVILSICLVVVVTAAAAAAAGESSAFVVTSLSSSRRALSVAKIRKCYGYGAMRCSGLNQEEDGHCDEIEGGEASCPAQQRLQAPPEMVLEELARVGADRIAALSTAERTKRAMLAEAIEDEIFAATETLESLLRNAKDGTLPEIHRERAVELAAKTKLFQVQHNELVSGTTSSVLNALESAFGRSDNSNSNNNDDDSPR